MGLFSRRRDDDSSDMSRSRSNSLSRPTLEHLAAEEAEDGAEFCAQHPLTLPTTLSETALDKILAGQLTLCEPPLMSVPTNSRLAKRFRGEISIQRDDGLVHVKSKKDTRDCTFVTDLPVYAPLSYRSARIYFEVTVKTVKDSAAAPDAKLALGFVCIPYPPFRLVGFHRASVALHAHDGRRYTSGLAARQLSDPYSEGQTLGVGINYVTQRAFCTRNGVLEAEWPIEPPTGTPGEPEYRDELALSPAGVDGEHDVYAAVGLAGGLSVVVNFGAAKFKFRDLNDD